MTRPLASPPIGRAALGGSTLTRGQRPANGISVPGYDAAYYWVAAIGSPAIGQAAIGGRASVLYPSAGLIAAPDADSATITVQLWWAYASGAEVVRVANGERTPIRASPVLLDRAQSRRNQASNPRGRDGLGGYAAGDVNSVLSRLTGLSTPIPRVTTATRVTAAAAGSVSLRADLDPVSTVPTAYSWLARTSVLASGLGVSVRWYDATGQDIGTVAYPASASARTAAATGWSWASVLIDSWPAGAAVGVLSYTAAGLPAGGTLDVTARLTETGTTAGDYLDGDQLGASWIGTPGLSASDLAQIAVVVDAEAPLDVPVHYELSSGAAPGFIARSEMVVVPADGLRSSDRHALLTHPGLAKTVPVWIETAPPVDNDLQQGVFRVKGRRNAVVVSDADRGGDEGQLTFVTETFDERDLLMDMLDDGSPLLLRSPPEFGYPPVWWLSFGKAHIEPLMPWAQMPVRKITVPFIEVDRPSAATRPLVA